MLRMVPPPRGCIDRGHRGQVFGDIVDTFESLSTEAVGCRFSEVSRMDERLEFVMLATAEGANIRQLCRRFGISPMTGYKWLDRWRRGGAAGLVERVAAAACFAGANRARDRGGGSGVCAPNIRPGAAARLPAVRGSRRRTGSLQPRRLPRSCSVMGCELGAFGGGERSFTRFEHDASQRSLADGLQGPCGAGRHGPAASADRARRSLALCAGAWPPAATSGRRRSSSA